MDDKSVKESDTTNKAEATHTSKKATAREQLVYGLKVFIIAGLVLLLLWLADRAV